MIKYSKPVKFRFVITDDEDNIIEVLYESKKEYDSQWDPEWEDECYHKVLELDEIYHFTDYENCPNVVIQMCYNGFWKFHEDVVDYWFNL
jgi:hypothetical protein